MKGYFILAITLFVLMSGISVASAEEAAKYNFGSMQAAKEITITPGEYIETKLYFYNVYGNRITHVSLFVSQAPEGWEVGIEPELHNTTVDISGIIVDIEETLYVEPSNATDTIPEDVPEGIEYISSSVGYIGAKPVRIKINVPEDEEIGKKFNITISASAEWLGQGGAVAIKQARDFDYTVTTMAGEFYEEIIEGFPEEAKTGEEVETPAGEVGEQGGAGITGFLVANAPWIGIIIVLVVILAYVGFARGRKEEMYKGYSYPPE